jgi:hypothetical protein
MKTSSIIMSLVIVFASVFGVKSAGMRKNRLEEAAAKKSEIKSENQNGYY